MFASLPVRRGFLVVMATVYALGSAYSASYLFNSIVAVSLGISSFRLCILVILSPCGFQKHEFRNGAKNTCGDVASSPSRGRPSPFRSRTPAVGSAPAGLALQLRSFSVIWLFVLVA